ncbi:hypothetical protein KAFR_0J00270 [Kazachstania africana CBS 2517]|uniref:Uncharacterized protein n=1 Tax=Kazachstania africana (strain ATCC 22294 / BCRC 22015 / CBS 2517 / CECT 1963 / NBRC 1671 / NRRL Y-8276) TaxID=1071382 RepID=H2B0E5_KAZAF|nr:hypothetical protein KAFR_0J00270 [Kazachstania africana CBS 2517]CCF60095.1 hypothetical protein KAFR_0J00270 [Kazachstania africana CBS 2517]
MWPFGQSLNSSGINKILDEYFEIFHALEHLHTDESEDTIRSNSNESKSGPCVLNAKSDDVIVNDEESNNTLNLELQSNPSSSELSLPSERSSNDHSGSSTSSGSSSLENVLSLTTVPMNTYTKNDLNASFIERLLGENELLNELTRQNDKLLDFFCYGYIFDNGVKILNYAYLIDHMLIALDSLGSNDINSQDENKNNVLSRATIISEIFAIDIWLISETLVKDSHYLGKIWSLIRHPNFNSESSPLVSIFLKIGSNLLFSKPEDFLNFVSTQETLVDDMVRHIDISLLMEFLLKIIGTDKCEFSTGIIDLLSKQDLISKCLGLLNNKNYSWHIQACAGDFLKALIAISANAPIDDISVGPNNLTRELACEKCVVTLSNIMINERGYALNVAVSIIIELIRKNNSDYDQINLLNTTLENNPPNDRDPIYLGYLLKTFTEKLPQLFKIVEEARKHELRENQLGEIFEPLGFERFKIVELIAELLHCSNMGSMNSKRAERIARKRDAFRKNYRFNHDSNSINNEDSNTITTNFKRLVINDNETNDDTTTNDVTTNTSNNNDVNNDIHNDTNDNDNFLLKQSQFSDNNIPETESDDSEIDESFEIPYINNNQNKKLRTKPTIGDFYKITLYDNRIIPKVLTMFMKFPWNNFWHNVIFDIVQQIFNGRMDFSYNSFLVYSLFNVNDSLKYTDKSAEENVDFKITNSLILQAYKDSYEFYDKRHTNLGYMGHLVLIAEEVVKFSKLYKVELISPTIYDTLQDDGWKYYSEEVLNETRLMYSKILGGGTYVDDGNGNIIPQFPDNNNSSVIMDQNYDTSPTSPTITSHIDEADEGNELINVQDLEEQLSTESDLHDKLREVLIAKGQNSIDARNERNGVIILGPP